MMKLASRYKWHLFVVTIWAIIFAVPSLRYHLKVMAQGSPWVRFTILPGADWDLRFAQETEELPLQARAIGDDFPLYLPENRFKRLERLDELIQKNPDLPWLIAYRLQATTVAFQSERIGGEWSDPARDENVKAGIPSPEKKEEKPNFTSAQMDKALALCRAGEKLEPQNAYFPWMRMYFLMLNWQDGPARQALSEAAAKSYWNSHRRDFQILYVRSVEKVLGRQLHSVEKMEVFYSHGSTPHAKMREMGRILGWEGTKLKRQGRHARALQLWGDWHRVMTLAVQGDADTYDFLVDYAVLSLAVDGASYPDRTALIATRKKLTTEQKIDRLLSYARQHGQPELANQIESDWKLNNALLQKVRANSNEKSEQGYPEIALHQKIVALYTLSVLSVFFVFRRSSGVDGSGDNPS